MACVTRRKALAALAALAALPAGVIFGALPLLAAGNVDPILAVIECHRDACRVLSLLDGDEVEWDAANRAEREAWDDLADTYPTTPAGLAAMTAYVASAPAALEYPPNLHRAMRTIAAVTAKFASTMWSDR